MKLKRTVSLLLCILMIVSFTCVPSYAADNKGYKVPFVINAVEEISGMFVSF